MSSRIVAMAATSFVVVISFLGCGGNEPQFDPATQYTAESLAKEIAFRCKTLDRSAPQAGAGDVVKSSTGAATKKGAETKAARTNSLDGLISESIDKASKIPGLTQAQACKKVADELSKDSEVSGADKKAITEALNKVSD